MKKILFLATCAVALTAFTGCTNDEDLSRVDPAVPAKGTPMTVTVTDGSGDVTRYTNTTTSNIAYFQMWAYNTTNTTEPANLSDALLMNNLGFSQTGSNGKFTNGDAHWPATNTNPCFFYAVSENVNNGTDKFSVGSGNFEASGYGTNFAPTLKYSLPTTTGTVALPTGNASIAATETTVVDLSEETGVKDFLVCTNKGDNGNGITEATNGSNLSMAFDHALADLEIAARLTSYEWVGGTVAEGGHRETCDVGDDAKIHINYIAIHGLFATGKYNFNTKEWTDLGGTSLTRTVYLYHPTTPITVNAQDAIVYTNPENVETGTGAANIKRTTIVPAGKLLIIPQTVTPWNKVLDIEGNEAEETAYIELNCSFEDFSGVEGLDDLVDDEEGSYTFYFPLEITNDTFVGGRKHKLLLNLNRICYADGAYALETILPDA